MASPRLKSILIKNNLPKPIFMLEFDPIDKINLPVKKTLNSIAGTYICINLINKKLYVGSASINCMYRRYTGHLLKGIGGSINVSRAVLKYGLKNFAFVVIETTKQVKDRKEIIRIEQKYIDLLKPEYNIAKIAGSRLNTKWTLESRNKHSIRVKEHLDKIRLLKKPTSAETRDLLRTIALNRPPVTAVTRNKMSINNNKSVKLIAYLADSNIIFREFISIADAAEYFFNDRNRRGPIKYALTNNTKILDKYYLRKSNTKE